MIKFFGKKTNTNSSKASTASSETNKSIENIINGFMKDINIPTEKLEIVKKGLIEFAGNEFNNGKDKEGKTNTKLGLFHLIDIKDNKVLKEFCTEKLTASAEKLNSADDVVKFMVQDVIVPFKKHGQKSIDLEEKIVPHKQSEMQPVAKQGVMASIKKKLGLGRHGSHKETTAVTDKVYSEAELKFFAEVLSTGDKKNNPLNISDLDVIKIIEKSNPKEFNDKMLNLVQENLAGNLETKASDKFSKKEVEAIIGESTQSGNQETAKWRDDILLALKNNFNKEFASAVNKVLESKNTLPKLAEQLGENAKNAKGNKSNEQTNNRSNKPQKNR
jgi:hypothetical protein